jgi:protein phosphatase
MVCRTDKGLVRERNEDFLGIDNSSGIVVLADGMGGYEGGDIASELAVRTIMNELAHPLKTLCRDKPHTNHRYHSATMLLEQAVLKANQIIHEMALAKAHFQNMGTTVVAVLFHNNFISIAHVGDSRLYRLRGNKLRQITKDHSLLEELDLEPEQARYFPNKNYITRALGIDKQVNVEIQEDNILPQDIYLLCSDGLTNMLDDSDMQNILSNTHRLDQAAKLLIEAANTQGGKDNISVILVRPLPKGSEPRQNFWLQRIFRNMHERISSFMYNHLSPLL